MAKVLPETGPNPIDYQATSLGTLPADWEVARLGDKLDREPRPPRPTAASRPTVPFLPMALLPSNGLYVTEWEERHPDAVRSGVPIRDGDLLLAKITPCLENGKQGIVRGLPGGFGYATTEVIPLRPVGIMTEFLAFYLKLPAVRHHLAEKMEGATGRQRLPKAVVDELVVPVPPIAEQQAIIHVLKTVEHARDADEQVIASARQLKRSLMHHLFTYGAVPVSKAERVDLNPTPFGPIPARWNVSPLERYAYVQTGVAKGRKLESDDVAVRPYLRVANVQDGYLDLSEIKSIPILASEVERYRLQPGDVLLTEGGDFDKLGRGFIWRGELPDCIHQNHVFAVRANQDFLLPDYLAYLCQSGYGKTYFLTVAHRTTHLACINSAKLKRFPVPLPPLSEQVEIVQQLRAVDRKIDVEEARRGGLQSLFKMLLRDLMRGGSVRGCDSLGTLTGT